MNITPGPWRVEPCQQSQGRALAIVADNGNVVARTPEVKRHNDPEQTIIDAPNARLLAAAPEMLALLCELIGEGADRYGYGAAHKVFDDGYRARVREVIARVKP